MTRRDEDGHRPRSPRGAALVVVDVQRGFDHPRWGRRNNPQCERNIELLIRAWRAAGDPLIFVRHDSREPESPLRPGQAGNELQDFLGGAADLLVTKSVHSAFHGTPDLHSWLRIHAVPAVVICGITTNHCCETTARVAADLGHRTTFVLDATRTFDRFGADGRVISADRLAATTAANLDGEFATVVATRALLAGEPPDRPTHRPSGT